MKLLQLFRGKKAKQAVVYHINDRLVIATVQKTIAGVGLENDPRVVTAPFDANEIAREVRRALDTSARVLKHPEQDEWKGMFQPIAKAAGARSWNAFAEKAKGVEIDETDGAIWITPYLSLGSKEGFKEAQDECVTVRDLDAVTTTLLQRFQI